MMTVKKLRFVIAASLMIAIVFTNFPFIASAVIPSGIDISRLRLENKIGHTVQLESGELELKGKLARQTPMTEEELEKLIKEAMEELGIKNIEQFNEMVEKAKQWDQITKEEVDEFIKDLIKTVGLASGIASALIKMVDDFRTNGISGTDGLFDASMESFVYFSEKYLEQKAAELAKEGLSAGIDYQILDETRKQYKKMGDRVGKFVGWAEYMKFLAEKYMRDQQKWKEITDAAKAKAQLNNFYDELQKKIDDFKNKNRDKGYWQIEFNHATAQRQNFSFFGVGGNNQTWELTMKLKQTQSTGDFSFDAENVAGSAAGTYEGEYTIKTDSELTVFASDPGTAIYEIGEHGENFRWEEETRKNMHANNRLYVESVSVGKANNIRTVKGQCRAYVLKDGEVQLTVDDGAQTIQNEFDGINIRINEVMHDGLSGKFLSHEALDAEIKALPSEKKVYIEYSPIAVFVAGNPDYSWEATIYNLQQGYGLAVSFSELEGLYDWDDSEIWTPWDDEVKTMRIVK